MYRVSPNHLLWVLEGLVATPEGRAVLIEREAGPPTEAEIMGARLGRRLLAAGARQILRAARPDPGRDHGGSD